LTVLGFGLQVLGSGFMDRRIHPDVEVDGRHPIRRSLCEGLVSRVSGFGIRVFGFVFQLSGFGFRVLNFGFRVLGSKFRVSDFGFRVEVIIPC